MSNLIKYKIQVAYTSSRNHESNVVLPHEYLQMLFEKKQMVVDGNIES
jgi:hypothetical protein